MHHPKKNIQPVFKKLFGALFFYHGDTLVYQLSSAEDYTFAFDKTTGVVHKHGMQSRVNHWLNHAPDRAHQSSVIGLSDNLITVSKPAEGDHAWDVELLNRFISKPGAIAEWYADQEETHSPRA